MKDIDFDSMLYGAVRNIPPKERGNRGFFPTSKVEDGIVEYESQIERDFFILLDHSDDVVRFQHQPVSIRYKASSGKDKIYTPDVFVQFSNNIGLMVEIKDYDTYEKKYEEFLPRWIACQEWCKSRGYEFIVYTDRHIRTPRFHNVWLTLGASKVTSNDDYVERLSSIIPEEGIEYNSLCEELSNRFLVTINKASQILLYAIYHGLIFVESFSHELITGKTVIRLNPKESSNSFLPLYLEIESQLLGTKKLVSTSDNSSTPIPFLHLNGEEILEENDPARNREALVKEFLKTPSKKRTPEWRDNFSKKNNIGISTVYDWIKKYQTNGRKGLKSKYIGSSSKWDDYTYDRMEKGRKHYLEKNSTLSRIFQEIVTFEWDHSHKKPSYHTFRRYVKQATSYYEDQLATRGYAARHDLEPSLDHYHGAIMPMQVLQFDNTPLDLFVNDQGGLSIGTPNLCAAIDVYTRQITGFELTLNSINRQSILETLVQSILPKTKYLDQLYGEFEYQPDWKIAGVPVLILVDNGLDYRSKDVKRFCMEYDIILEFAPLRKPRYKAYIENWFNILRIGIREELSEEGYRPNIINRIQNPDLNPETNSIFTIQQSELWLTSWILDDYHFTNPYNDGRQAPVLRYEDYELGQGPMILPEARKIDSSESSIDDIIVFGLMSTTRTLNDNIDFLNLKYSSQKLYKLYKQLGKVKITVLYDNRDIRVIWIIDPLTNRPMRLQLTTGWSNAFFIAYQDLPVSVSSWKQEVKQIKIRNRKKINLSIFKKERGKNFRISLRNQALTGKKMRRKSEILVENQKKLERKVIHKSRKSDPPKIIQVNEKGEFIRNYVPIPDEIKAALQQNRKRS